MRRLGPSMAGGVQPRTPLRDVPSAETLAGTAPALLESFDLSAGRALALRRAAREVAAGRVDLRAGDHERGWRRLRALPGIGSWTVECLALHGQGRFDQLPAGDLGLRKLVGRLRSGGDPRARAQEEEVREFFAPYAPWAGLAASLRAARRRQLELTICSPSPGRNSSVMARPAFCPLASRPCAVIQAPNACQSVGVLVAERVARIRGSGERQRLRQHGRARAPARASG